MFYNINTAAEINLMRRHERALHAEWTERDAPVSLPTLQISSGAWRTGSALWVLLQLFGGSRWF